jgi:hypothetical protein
MDAILQKLEGIGFWNHCNDGFVHSMGHVLYRKWCMGI